MRVDVLHLSVMEKRKTSSSSTGNGVLSNYDDKNPFHFNQTTENFHTLAPCKFPTQSELS